MNDDLKKYPPEFYREKIFALTNLPTLPTIATEILKVTRDEKVSINQVLPIIEKDPPSAMKILKVANSAYYGLKKEVKSLRHAIVIIGLGELSNIVTSFSLIKLFSQDGVDHHLQWKQFWKHSIACGSLVQLLQEETDSYFISNPYSYGLLHDIGKLVLYRVDASKYIKCIDLINKTQCTSIEAEQEIFGITHALAGKWIAEKWKLPLGIINSIEFHHDPLSASDSKDKVSALLVQLADIVCNSRYISFGTGVSYLNFEESPSWMALKERIDYFKELDYKSFMATLDEEIETIKDFVELMQV